MVTAPYETSLTALFTSIGQWAGFMEQISPAIIAWIQAKIPLEKQRIMDRRLRKCKRRCKNNFNPASGVFGTLVKEQVDQDFADTTDSQRAEITDLLINELQLNK